MPLYTVTTQAGVLGAEPRVKLAGEITASSRGVCRRAEELGACRVSGLRGGQRLHGGGGGGDSRADACHPKRPAAGLQARHADAPLGVASGRDRCAGRPDRHRHSGGAREPGHGNGEDHAGRRQPVRSGLLQFDTGMRTASAAKREARPRRPLKALIPRCRAAASPVRGINAMPGAPQYMREVPIGGLEK